MLSAQFYLTFKQWRTTYLLKKVGEQVCRTELCGICLSRSDRSREAWQIEDPELEDLDFRHQQRTVEPNGKNPPKIKIKQDRRYSDPKARNG